MSKHLIRPWALGMVWAMTSMIMGCAEAQETPVYTNAPTPSPAAPVESDDQEELQEGREGEAPTTNSPAPRLVQAATTPADLQVSPALREVIRLVQAGVDEEVLLAYITNSTRAYFLGSEEIVYLNDLGVSSKVLTALIERDTRPDAAEEKRLAESAAPLPAGLALNSPATNIYVTNVPESTESNEGPAPAGEAAAVPEEDRLPEAAVPTANAEITSSYFYDSLAPYGNWVQVENYGLCWQPTVAVANSGWRPYGDRGRWLWTTSGWYWYSDYTWGWAPFHYGRWHASPASGWVWVPGSVWGPSWVTWRYTDAYCGWAPLPPYTYYSAGLGLSYLHDSVHVGFGFGFGFNHYVFSPWDHFCDFYPRHHFVHGRAASVIYRDSVVVNNFGTGPNQSVINRGFGRDLAARRARQNIDEVVVRPEARQAGAARPERLVQEGRSRAIIRPQLTAASAASSGGGEGEQLRRGAGEGRGGSQGRPANGGARNFQAAPATEDSFAISGSTPGVARPFSSRGFGPSARAFDRSGNVSSREPAVTGNGGSVARSAVQVAPRVENGAQTRVTIIRRSPRSSTRSRSFDSRGATAAEPVRRPTPSPNTQLPSVYTPPPSVITRPPSVITRPPSVITRPPSVITRPPSVTGSRAVGQSIPIFRESPAARPSLAPPSRPSSPAGNFNRPTFRAPSISAPTISRPAPSVSRPSPAISRPSAGVSRPAGGGAVSGGSSARTGGRGRGNR